MTETERRRVLDNRVRRGRGQDHGRSDGHRRPLGSTRLSPERPRRGKRCGPMLRILMAFSGEWCGLRVHAHLDREPVGVHVEVLDDGNRIVTLMDHLVDGQDGRDRSF